MRPFCVLTAALALVDPATRPTVAPPPQVVVLRAQPSVLQVLTSIDIDFKRPTQFDARRGAGGATLLHEEFEAAKANLPPGTTEQQFCWLRIAADPGQYLHIFGTETAFTIADQLYQTGSGFVVDQAGTLLTNQHVIDVSEVPRDARAFAGYLDDDVGRFIEALVGIVGEAPPDELVPAIDQQFVPWVLAHYKVAAVRRSQVRIATHLLPGAQRRLLSIRPKPAATDWRQNTVVCEVLVTGENYPGKDIAVLRASSLAARLISLPLGDSARFALGSNVYALGFPAAAVIDGVDPLAARYRVIAHDGILDQRLPMKKGWEAFHMTANINHGDSGGPVIDEQGRVVAVTVAGSNEAAAQNLAIPINLAKEFLSRAKVVVGPRNEVTTAWYAACDAFAAGRHKEALPLFQKVSSLQGGWALGTMSGGSQATDMIDLCKREIGTTPVVGTGTGLQGQKPVPVPGKPILTRLRAEDVAPADDSWWSPWWAAYCDFPLYQQVMIGIVVLSLLGGVLKALRGLF